MGDMVAKVDLEGEELDDVVANWMTTNEARWQEWIK
jgi:glycine betaine/proline transport system substrate-binding protein